MKRRTYKYFDKEAPDKQSSVKKENSVKQNRFDKNTNLTNKAVQRRGNIKTYIKNCTKKFSDFLVDLVIFFNNLVIYVLI